MSANRPTPTDRRKPTQTEVVQIKKRRGLAGDNIDRDDFRIDLNEKIGVGKR